MKVRIKFLKTGHLKYIGHLDIMRCFQKIMRRAKVDIAYSAGFSPHQIMSFASPLGLGLTSEGEYVDIEVISTESSEKMIERINNVSVDGIKILSYVKLPDNAKTAMAVIAAADYMVNFDEEFSEELRLKFKEFLSQESIVITKQTKKQTLDMEIRPLIFKTQFRENSIFMKVSSGSVANLKPEQVMDAFWKFCGEDKKVNYHVHRLEMYANISKPGKKMKLVPLESLGENID